MAAEALGFVNVWCLGFSTVDGYDELQIYAEVFCLSPNILGVGIALIFTWGGTGN